MDLSKYVTQLREDLASAAAAGDEQTQRTGALLGAAIEPAARLALMNALADLAAEVTAALGDRVVEVRLDGRDVRVAVSPDAGRRAGAGGRRRARSRASAARLRGLRRDAGDISPRHAAAGRADQEPGRAGRGEPGHVAQLLGGPGRSGRLSGSGRRATQHGKAGRATGGCRVSDRRAARRQARRQGLGAGMSEPIDFTEPTTATESATAPPAIDDRDSSRRESWPVRRRRRAGAVGRRRAHRGAPRPGRRARGAGRGAPRPGRGRHVGPGHQRRAQLARPGDGRAGRASPPTSPPRRCGRPRSPGRSPGGG